MIDEVKEILRVKYGRDVMGVIISFMFPQCEGCNTYYIMDRMFETYKKSYICMYCYTKLNYKRCQTCRKMFKYEDNVWCRSCQNNCRIYCRVCLLMEYRRGFSSSNITALDVIDDIIYDVLT